MWDASKGQRFQSLRCRELEGELSGSEHGELKQLLRELEELEAVCLAPAMERLHQERGRLEAEAARLEDQTQELAALLREKEAYLARARAVVAELELERTAPMKRKYSGLTLEEAMQLVPAERLTPWNLDAPPRAPSDTLREGLRRLESFDLVSSEAAKTLLIDELLQEIVPDYPRLKVWKAAPLETDTLTGTADYVIAPNRAYMATPLLCVAEAKRDDFEAGRAQCIAEMVACAWKNRQKNHDTDVYGIVSNGQGWVFYKLTLSGEVFETQVYTTQYLPQLLGALDRVCAECAKNIP